MTSFIDGPAWGQHLSLRRSPFLLRVTKRGTTFDALDQVGDEPETGEVLFAYVIAGKPSWCHIKSSKPGASGFFMIAQYKLVDPQPSPEEMATRRSWVAWCEKNAAALGWKGET